MLCGRHSCAVGKTPFLFMLVFPLILCLSSSRSESRRSIVYKAWMLSDDKGDGQFVCVKALKTSVPMERDAFMQEVSVRVKQPYRPHKHGMLSSTHCLFSLLPHQSSPGGVLSSAQTQTRPEILRICLWRRSHDRHQVDDARRRP